jgi:hypothetical protein
MQACICSTVAASWMHLVTLRTSFGGPLTRYSNVRVPGICCSAWLRARSTCCWAFFVPGLRSSPQALGVTGRLAAGELEAHLAAAFLALAECLLLALGGPSDLVLGRVQDRLDAKK